MYILTPHPAWLLLICSACFVLQAILGPTPAEPVGDFARTVVRDVCRGARYVFEPRWYMGVYLLRACLPEVLAWNSRLLTVDTVGASTTDTLGKWLVELPGVRRVVQPPSLRSPEIKD
jgi:11beta/17beta-hydroxysteroid dehydrogenase